MGLSLGNYSLVELGGVARGARDSALQNLRQAERQIDQVRQLLRRRASGQSFISRRWISSSRRWTQ